MSVRFLAADQDAYQAARLDLPAAGDWSIFVRFKPGTISGNMAIYGIGDSSTSGIYWTVEVRTSGARGGFQRSHAPNGQSDLLFTGNSWIAGQWNTMIVWGTGSHAANLQLNNGTVVSSVVTVAAPSTNLRTTIGRDATAAATNSYDGWAAEIAVTNQIPTAAQRADFHNGRGIETVIAPPTWYTKYRDSDTPSVGLAMTAINTPVIDSADHPPTIYYVPKHFTDTETFYCRPVDKSIFSELYFGKAAGLAGGQMAHKIAGFGDSTWGDVGGEGRQVWSRIRMLWHNYFGHTPGSQLIPSLAQWTGDATWMVKGFSFEAIASTAMTIHQDGAGGSTEATVQITDTQMVLIVTGGTFAGTTTLTFSDILNDTMGELVTIINALAIGWTATLVAPAARASTDLAVLAATNAFGVGSTVRPTLVFERKNMPPGWADRTQIHAIGQYSLQIGGTTDGGRGDLFKLNHRNDNHTTAPFSSDGGFTEIAEAVAQGNAMFADGTMHGGASCIDCRADNLNVEWLAMTNPGSVADCRMTIRPSVQIHADEVGAASKQAATIFGGANTLNAAVGTIRKASTAISYKLASTEKFIQSHCAGSVEAAATGSSGAWLFGKRWWSGNKKGLINDVFAEGGYMISDILDYHPGCFGLLQQIGHDGIMIGLGTNEGGLSITAAQFDANLRSLINLIRASAPSGYGSTIPITFVPPPYRTGGSTINGRVENEYFAGVYRQICDEFPYCSIVNTRLITHNAGWTAANQATYLSDGVHYTDTGGQAYAQALVNTLISNLAISTGSGGGLGGAGRPSGLIAAGVM